VQSRAGALGEIYRNLSRLMRVRRTVGRQQDVRREDFQLAILSL
jgi:hypothetical protein